MSKWESTDLGGLDREAIRRTLSMSAATIASVLMAVAFAAIDMDSALGLSHSVPGECH
jgi:hypothetical protein